MRNDFFSPEIGKRDKRPAIMHQFLGTLRDSGEAVTGDIEAHLEVLRRGVDIAACQLVLVGKGNGMHYKIKLAPIALQLFENGVQAGVVGDIAWHNFGIDALRQRAHAAFKGLALIGEGQFSAGIGTCFGNAPGNRALIGNAHN